jgi:hypothetical protein
MNLYEKAAEIVVSILEGEKNSATLPMIHGAVEKELRAIRRAALKEAADRIRKDAICGCVALSLIKEKGLPLPHLHTINHDSTCYWNDYMDLADEIEKLGEGVPSDPDNTGANPIVPHM